jgi:hypothetical protein
VRVRRGSDVERQQAAGQVTPPLRIFLNYRRGEGSGHTGRLYDALSARFGAQNVFMDVDAIEPGLDFTQVIAERVGAADVLLAVIGRQWLDISDVRGRQRLTRPDDFVRLELGTALAREGTRVIPVLIQGAEMPSADDLPDDLKTLAVRHAVEIRDTSWSSDVARLERALERIRTPAEDPPPQPPSPPGGPESRTPPGSSQRRRPTRRMVVAGGVVAAVAAAAAVAIIVIRGGGAREISFNAGRIRVAVSGPTSTTVDQQLAYAFYDGAEGDGSGRVSSLSWGPGQSAKNVDIRVAVKGRNRTTIVDSESFDDNESVVDVTVPGYSQQSTLDGGVCRIAWTRADPSAIAGRLQCSDLGRAKFDVSGSFAAALGPATMPPVKAPTR